MVLVAQDMQANGLLSRDEVEDPLSDAIESANLSEVMGGGGGSSVYIIDVQVSEEQFEVRAPPSSEIRRHSPREACRGASITVLRNRPANPVLT